jgi:hypothetical protein
MATGCIHDLRWYVRQLGAALLRELPTPADLRQCLAHAISTVTAAHADTCDTTHTGTPSATVAIVRERDNALDYLVLSDTTIIFDCYTDLHIITDDSVEQVAVTELNASRRQRAGTPAHDERLHDLIAAQRRLRNTPEGYWLAGSRPEAADHAITGSVPLTDLRRAAVLTDGAAQLVEPFRITDWPGFLDILNQRGPRQLIHQIRETEASDPHGQRWPRHKPHDDATIAYLTHHRDKYLAPRPRQLRQTSSPP